jgi:hypothetical protein
VKFVRLTLLEPMSEEPGDSGELFIDFRELEVFGGPPNQPPWGALSGPQGPQLGRLRGRSGDRAALPCRPTPGEVPERLNGHDWKSCDGG